MLRRSGALRQGPDPDKGETGFQGVVQCAFLLFILSMSYNEIIKRRSGT